MTWALFAPRLGAGDRVRLSKTVAAGKHQYPGRDEVALTARLPAYVAAVYVYRHGLTKVLFGDFDVKKAIVAGSVDPVALVGWESADFARLITKCGGHSFGDQAPGGGRHRYVPWAANIGFGDMRRVAQALARRYVTFDPAPMLNIREGLITPPGAWHRSGGFRALTDPVSHAQRVLDEPNGPDVWSRLLDALQPELEALETALLAEASPDAATVDVVLEEVAAGIRQKRAAPSDQAAWAVDEDGVDWLPRPDGPLPRLSPLREQIAKTGEFDASVYGSPSEARQAVLSSAVSCGWRLADVAARMRAGDWPGLVGFYARYRDDRQRVQALQADWKKAVHWIAEREFGREIHTGGSTHRGGSGEGVRAEVRPPTSGTDPISELRKSRRWYSAYVAAVRNQRWAGRKLITVRRVLLAMLKAAQLRHSMVVGFGVRELALLACLDYSTVAKTLKDLREEPDPFLDLVEEHHGDRPDVYHLIVPHTYAEAAAWRRLRPGRLGGIHQVFRELGGPAAFVYEQLGDVPIRTCDVPGLAVLSVTATNDALHILAEHDLARRTRWGWVRGSADPDKVAEHLGVPEVVAGIVKKYRRQRAEWRAFLAIVDAFGPTDTETEEDPIPLEDIMAAGPPPWMEDEPHGPPVASGTGISPDLFGAVRSCSAR
ncbi:hypothetical protein ABT352_32860 [Streptosporangium sp. NPDC000563]|uniref:hypothetical protein n=1 Tax=Streptosporangium sp. NPDC000563 TaxID=3154366 RepID=UPI0033211C1A